MSTFTTPTTQAAMSGTPATPTKKTEKKKKSKLSDLGEEEMLLLKLVKFQGPAKVLALVKSEQRALLQEAINNYRELADPKVLPPGLSPILSLLLNILNAVKKEEEGHEEIVEWDPTDLQDKHTATKFIKPQGDYRLAAQKEHEKADDLFYAIGDFIAVLFNPPAPGPDGAPATPETQKHYTSQVMKSAGDVARMFTSLPENVLPAVRDRAQKMSAARVAAKKKLRDAAEEKPKEKKRARAPEPEQDEPDHDHEADEAEAANNSSAEPEPEEGEPVKGKRSRVAIQVEDEEDEE